MKTSLRIFILTLFCAFSLSAWAGSPKKYFDSLAEDANFDYTYVSPYMLKAMGGTMLDNGGFSICARDITSIENVSTIAYGTSKKLWKQIDQVKNDKKLQTLSTKKHGIYRYDVLGRLSNDDKYLTNLLVVTQNTGDNVIVVYIEGKIPLANMNIDF